MLLTLHRAEAACHGIRTVHHRHRANCPPEVRLLNVQLLHMQPHYQSAKSKEKTLVKHYLIQHQTPSAE